MPVVTRCPGPPLDGLVTAITYRYGEQPHASVEKILPSAETGLWVNLNRDAFRSFTDDGRVRQVPGAMLAGPTSRAAAFEFEQGHGHVAVSFALGGAGRFFAAPLPLAADELVPLEAVWGGAGASLRERLLEAGSPDEALDVMEAVLLAHLAGMAGPDPAVLAAAAALSRGARVTQAAEDLGLLTRTLRRRFAAEVGLTPKRFGRVQRMQRLVRDLDGRTEIDWAAEAAGHGYADQPHLADEFRDLAGVTATEYLRSRINGPNHLRFPGSTRSADP
jgi:AraC-like DNA-binding protein